MFSLIGFLVLVITTVVALEEKFQVNPIMHLMVLPSQ